MLVVNVYKELFVLILFLPLSPSFSEGKILERISYKLHPVIIILTQQCLGELMTGQ